MALTNHVYCPWMQLFDFLDFPYQFSLKQNFGDCFAKKYLKDKTKMQETHVFHVKYFLHIMIHYSLRKKSAFVWKKPLTNGNV